MLAGRAKAIQQERERKLEEARKHRAAAKRDGEASDTTYTKNARPEDKAMLGSNVSAESEPKTDCEVTIS